jgi:poly-beta-1,6-N-acetyl-D-glucosamine biosynthesis protein PgaD
MKVGQQSEGLIIDRPGSMTHIRRGMELSVTTFGWIVWLFVCRPLLITLLWAMGFRFFYEHMVSLGGVYGLRELWLIYTSIIICILVFVRGWGVYNKMKFGKRQRRTTAVSVKPDELDKYYALPPGSMGFILESKVVRVDFLSDQRCCVRCGDAGREQSFCGKFRR